MAAAAAITTACAGLIVACVNVLVYLGEHGDEAPATAKGGEVGLTEDSHPAKTLHPSVLASPGAKDHWLLNQRAVQHEQAVVAEETYATPYPPALNVSSLTFVGRVVDLDGEGSALASVNRAENDTLSPHTGIRALLPPVKPNLSRQEPSAYAAPSSAVAPAPIEFKFNSPASQNWPDGSILPGLNGTKLF